MTAVTSTPSMTAPPARGVVRIIVEPQPKIILFSDPRRIVVEQPL